MHAFIANLNPKILIICLEPHYINSSQLVLPSESLDFYSIYGDHDVFEPKKTQL